MSEEHKPSVSSVLSRPAEDIAEFLGSVYEHSSWVAKELSAKSENYISIETVSQLAASLKRIVDDSSNKTKIKLLNSHPDLCEKVGLLTKLTKESQEEQSRSGLQTLTEDELESFNVNNVEYRERFGFPFILAVRNATKYVVLSALKSRVKNTEEVEMANAMEQVHKIAWMRLLAKLDTSDAKGFLTCHVLDTANGCPAVGMRVQLHRFSPSKSLIKEFVTNADGRLDGGPALVGGNEFIVGLYEFSFFTTEYFASKGNFTSGTPFLDEIPIRFGIDNPDDHYHVPLLVSPWSYSTYRGS